MLKLILKFYEYFKIYVYVIYLLKILVRLNIIFILKWNFFMDKNIKMII